MGVLDVESATLVAGVRFGAVTMAVLMFVLAVPAGAMSEPPPVPEGWEVIPQTRVFEGVNPCTGDLNTSFVDRVLHVKGEFGSDFRIRYWTSETTDDGWTTNGWMMAQMWVDVASEEAGVFVRTVEGHITLRRDPGDGVIHIRDRWRFVEIDGELVVDDNPDVDIWCAPH